MWENLDNKEEHVYFIYIFTETDVCLSLNYEEKEHEYLTYIIYTDSQVVF